MENRVSEGERGENPGRRRPERGQDGEDKKEKKKRGEGWGSCWQELERRLRLESGGMD